MNMTVTSVDQIQPLSRSEARTLVETENQRVLDLLSSLTEEDWARQTDCPAWDVRSLAGHILGSMEGFSTYRELIHMMRAAKKEAGKGSFIDGLTTVQVRERAELTQSEVLGRLPEQGQGRPSSGRGSRRRSGRCR